MSRVHRQVCARKARSAALVGALLAMAPPAAAQLTPELLARFQWIEESAISPDGQWIAYVRSTSAPPGGASKGRARELFLIDADGGEPRKLVSAEQRPRSPTWSRDGSILAVLAVVSARHPRQQVYRISLESGEEGLLTDAAHDVSAFAFSPDGRTLAYLAAQAPSDSVAARELAGYDAIVAGEPRLHTRLWVKASGGAARPITPADRTVRSFAWSPDGSSFAVQVTEGTDRAAGWNFRRLYTVAAGGGELTLLTRTEGPLSAMAWSPDGAWLAFIGATSLRDPAPQSVFVVRAAGGEAIDRTVGYRGSAVWVGWLTADTVLFGAIEGTRTAINRMGAAEGPIEHAVADTAMSFVFIGADIETGVSLDANARTFAAPMNTAWQPDELYVGATDGRFRRRLTNHNAAISRLRLSRQERIEWQGADGLMIEGIFLHPLNETPERRYPLVVMPHGGPERASLDDWFGVTWPQSPAQLFAAHGYAVLTPNYRGSIGRGVAFSRANQRDLGGKDLDDIIRGIDHLISLGLVDSTRVAIQGQSQGGYLAALAAALHGDRFKAAIASAPVTNWISYTGSYDNAVHLTMAHWDLRWYEHPGLLWDRSPAAHVHRDWAPLHIDHGLLDADVPVLQSKELYQALQLAGATTRLVLYPREGHEYVEEAHQIDVMRRYLEWLEIHLGGDRRTPLR